MTMSKVYQTALFSIYISFILSFETTIKSKTSRCFEMDKAKAR